MDEDDWAIPVPSMQEECLSRNDCEVWVRFDPREALWALAAPLLPILEGDMEDVEENDEAGCLDVQKESRTQKHKSRKMIKRAHKLALESTKTPGEEEYCWSNVSGALELLPYEGRCSWIIPDRKRKCKKTHQAVRKDTKFRVFKSRREQIVYA
jgi:hypothetical protein